MTTASERENRAPIRELCAKWKEAASRESGIAIGGASESYRLHANGISFHELDYDELREAAVGLADILLLPGLSTVVDLDHTLLWSWCGELLLGGLNAPFALSVDPEIAGLATTAIRAALAHAKSPSREAFERSRQASRLMEPNAHEYLIRAHDALPYLAFPFLEAVARRACAEYVELDGRVLKPFRKYGDNSYAVGRRCSNVAHLLRLLVETVGSPALRSDLHDVLAHIGELGGRGAGEVGDGYDVIFDWRNSSLHGETSLSTIGGSILTVALLVALDGIRGDYPARRAEAFERAVREVSISESLGEWRPSPWSFYPPFHDPQAARPQSATVDPAP